MTSKSLMTIVLSAVFFFAALSGQAQAQTTASSVDADGWVQSYDQAVSLSEASGKPIMLVFSGSDWCSYCQRLEQEVLQTAEFKSWASENVIKVMVDFPRYQSLPIDVATQNQNLKQRFAANIKGYPTVLMIKPSGSVIGKTGYVAGGSMPWIAKADPIVRQPQHRLAGRSK